jgi:hypothetical protein
MMTNIICDHAKFDSNQIMCEQDRSGRKNSARVRVPRLVQSEFTRIVCHPPSNVVQRCPCTPQLVLANVCDYEMPIDEWTLAHTRATSSLTTLPPREDKHKRAPREGRPMTPDSERRELLVLRKSCARGRRLQRAGEPKKAAFLARKQCTLRSLACVRARVCFSCGVSPAAAPQKSRLALALAHSLWANAEGMNRAKYSSQSKARLDFLEGGKKLISCRKRSLD